MDELMPSPVERRKRLLIVKRGLENIALLLDEIAFFYTEQKLVYAVHKSGRRYYVDQNLTELEEDLDEQVFFRANRQYIISVNFIKSFRVYEKARLTVNLDIPDINPCVIISQETASEFRKWIYAA